MGVRVKICGGDWKADSRILTGRHYSKGKRRVVKYSRAVPALADWGRREELNT